MVSWNSQNIDKNYSDNSTEDKKIFQVNFKITQPVFTKHLLDSRYCPGDGDGGFTRGETEQRPSLLFHGEALCQASQTTHCHPSPKMSDVLPKNHQEWNLPLSIQPQTSNVYLHCYLIPLILFTLKLMVDPKALDNGSKNYVLTRLPHI